MRFDLIIFDCDGVLVDSEPLANEVEAELLTNLGMALTPEDARVLFKGKTVGEGKTNSVKVKACACNP